MVMKLRQEETYIDLSFLPDTYWPESPDREMLRSRIQGKARRDIARRTLEAEAIEEALTAPGTKARNERGALPLANLKVLDARCGPQRAELRSFGQASTEPTTSGQRIM